MITLSDLQSAQSRLVGVTVHTNLIEFPENMWGQPPSAVRRGTRLLLKPENQQPIGAFKLRGAYNNIAPAIKREATAKLGAEIVLVGPGSDERKNKAEELAAEHGYVIVPPYNDEKIIAGQGTIGLEILDDMPDVETVLA